MPINEDHRYRWPCIKHTAFLQCRDYYIRDLVPCLFSLRIELEEHIHHRAEFRNFHLIFRSSKIEN